MTAVQNGKTSDRLKTEIIHEQAMVTKLLRERMESAESDVIALSTRLRTLELKHKVLEKTYEKLTQEYEQFKLSETGPR